MEIYLDGALWPRVCVLGGRQRRRRTSFLRVSHVKKHTVRDAIFFQRSPSTNGIDRLARKSVPGTRRPNGAPETGRRHSATTGKPLPSPAPPTLPERKSELSVRGEPCFSSVFFSPKTARAGRRRVLPRRVCVVFVSRGYGGTAVPLHADCLLLRDAGRNPTLARPVHPATTTRTHARTHRRADFPAADAFFYGVTGVRARGEASASPCARPVADRRERVAYHRQTTEAAATQSIARFKRLAPATRVRGPCPQTTAAGWSRRRRRRRVLLQCRTHTHTQGVSRVSYTGDNINGKRLCLLVVKNIVSFIFFNYCYRASFSC